MGSLLSGSKASSPLSDASALTSATAPASDEIFESEDGPGMTLNKNDSTSGRKSWQQKHKKGTFGKKKNSHRVAGTFTKSKAPK